MNRSDVDGQTTITLFADVEIAAPPGHVFRALTEPDELARWWGDGTYRAQEWAFEPFVGGRWSVRLTDAAGSESYISGEIREFDEPRALEYTWNDGNGPPSVVRYDLQPTVVRGTRGTRVTVTHTGVGGITACAGHHALPSLEWRHTLDRLARHLDTVVVLARAA